MFVRFNKSLVGDYGRARKGDVREVKGELGEKLVQLGYAAKTSGPAKSGAVAKGAKAAKAAAAAAKAAKSEKPEPSAQS